MKNDDLARLITYYLLDNTMFTQIAKDSNYDNMLDSGIEEMVGKSRTLIGCFDRKTTTRIVRYLNKYQKFVQNV